jgi:hypothetical protein
MIDMAVGQKYEAIRTLISLQNAGATEAEIVESIHFYRLTRKQWQDQGQGHDGGNYNGVNGNWNGNGSNSNISNNNPLHNWIKSKAFKLDSELLSHKKSKV